MATAGQIVCFGELLLRLSAPGRGHLFQEPRLNADFGGAEANVAVALARLGVPSAIVSAAPDDALGDAAVEAMRRHGVDMTRVRRAAGRLGLYFLTPGAGLRASAIVYDRENSLFAQTPPDAYDWPELLAGAGRLHLSGINPAIGPQMVEVALAAIAAADAVGVPVSFDGNFRASMWARWCDAPSPILARHIKGCDLMFGSHRDIALLLNRDFPGEGSERRRAAALAAFERFPKLRYIATTTRHVHNADHNTLSARIDTPDEAVETGEVEITGIVDRIGTGDAFAGGVLAGLPHGLEEAARTGLALAALKHATPGDQSLVTRRELATFHEGGLDVRR